MDDSGVRNSCATSLASRRSRAMAACWRSSKVLMEASTDSEFPSRRSERPDAGLPWGPAQPTSSDRAYSGLSPGAKPTPGPTPPPAAATARLDHLLGNVLGQLVPLAHGHQHHDLRLRSAFHCEKLRQATGGPPGSDQQTLLSRQTLATAPNRWPPPRGLLRSTAPRSRIAGSRAFKPGSGARWARTPRQTRTPANSAAATRRWPNVRRSAHRPRAHRSGTP